MERVTLKGLLKSEDVAIVVPEIQREYVWGAKESIRNQFIDSLEMRKEQSPPNRRPAGALGVERALLKTRKPRLRVVSKWWT